MSRRRALRAVLACEIASCGLLRHDVFVQPKHDRVAGRRDNEQENARRDEEDDKAQAAWWRADHEKNGTPGSSVLADDGLNRRMQADPDCF